MEIEGYNKVLFTREGELNDIPACYYCVVNSTNSNITEVENNKNLSNEEKSKRKSAYLRTLAREKYNLNKASEFVNGSPLLNS